MRTLISLVLAIVTSTPVTASEIKDSINSLGLLEVLKRIPTEHKAIWTIGNTIEQQIKFESQISTFKESDFEKIEIESVSVTDFYQLDLVFVEIEGEAKVVAFASVKTQAGDRLTRCHIGDYPDYLTELASDYLPTLPSVAIDKKLLSRTKAAIAKCIESGDWSAFIDYERELATSARNAPPFIRGTRDPSTFATKVQALNRYAKLLDFSGEAEYLRSVKLTESLTSSVYLIRSAALPTIFEIHYYVDDDDWSMVLGASFSAGGEAMLKYVPDIMKNNEADESEGSE